MTLDELITLLPAAKSAIEKLEKLAVDYLKNGGSLETRSLATKYGNRVWSRDKNETAAKLASMGIDPYSKRELVSPARAEALIEAKGGKPDLTGLTYKPETGLKLVPKREGLEGLEAAQALANVTKLRPLKLNLENRMKP